MAFITGKYTAGVVAPGDQSTFFGAPSLGLLALFATIFLWHRAGMVTAQGHTLTAYDPKEITSSLDVIYQFSGEI